MPAGRVELRIEVETEGAEQLTRLRDELNRLGTTGADAVGGLDRSLAAVLDKLQLSRTLVADSTRSFLDSHRQLFAGMAPLFDNFFRSVLGGSRSLRDALKRLWSDFLNFFLSLIRRMLASWLDALGLMSSAPGRSFGLGGLAGLFGGFFGSSGPGFGLGSLGPSGLTGGFPSLDRSGGPAFGGVSDLFRGLGPIPGQVLFLGGLLAGTAGVQRGSPLLGAAGGAAAGFAVGGPLGAAIGAIVGGLAGLFRRGKIRRQATRVLEQAEAQLWQVVEAFKKFQLDYEAALAQVQQIAASFSEALTPFGKYGRRGQRWLAEQVLPAVLKQINDLQSLRQQRTKLLAGLPIPEFQLGGVVGALNQHGSGRPIHSAQGSVLAFLHAGEAVLNRRAVQALGERTIERLNREPSRAGRGTLGHDQFYVTIQAVDGESVERWLARNEARFVRFLRRAARDRGLRPPV